MFSYSTPLNLLIEVLRREQASGLTILSLKSNGQLDFSNPESVHQLTKSLLKRDFGLAISLPPDRLCPPVSPSVQMTSRS